MQLKLKVHDLKERSKNKKRWVLGATEIESAWSKRVPHKQKEVGVGVGGGATEIDLIDVQECELILW